MHYVAEHTEAASRSDTPFAIGLWVLIILMGSSAIKEPVIAFVPAAIPLLTLVWLGLYGIAIASLLRFHQINWIMWLLRYRLLLVLALIGTVSSAFWAVDLNLSLQRGVHLFGCSLLAVYAGFSLSLQTLLKTLLWTAIALIFASPVMALALPELGIQSYEGGQVWKGILSDKNVLGFWATMTVSLCLLHIQSQQSLWLKMIVAIATLVGLVVLIKSESATSLLALGAALGAVSVLALSQRLNLNLAQQALLSALGIAAVVLLIQTIDTHSLNALLGRSGNLTGRGEVWKQTWALILERPLGGYGYGNLWNPTDSSIWIQKNYTNFSWVVFHAHNGLLHIASEIGLILTGILVIYMLQQIFESIQCYDQQPNRASLFIIAYSVAFLFTNYSEARIMINRDFFWILYLAMPISLLRHSLPPQPHQQPAQGTGLSS